MVIHDAQGLPAMLPVLDAILLDHCKRVGKDASCNLKTDAVLPEIAFRLRRVPFKSCFHALMLLHFCFIV